MRSRASAEEISAAALIALEAAVGEIDLELVAQVAEPSSIEIRLPGGRQIALAVVSATIVDLGKAEETIATVAKPTIVVADMIGIAAREVLAGAGVSWLDRRGHLHVSADNVWIDRDIGPLPRTRRSGGGRVDLGGAAALAVAAGHLIDPSVYGGVRPLARLVGLSPSAISQARQPLIDGGHLSHDQDARSELFWALAAAWRPAWHDLARMPPSGPGLVACGTRAAGVLGAPIIATDAYPVEVYAVDSATLERTRLRTGPATGEAPARAAVAPTLLVTLVSPGVEAKVSGHRVVHPLFAALDLAGDPSRGAEALADWGPEGWDRAW